MINWIRSKWTRRSKKKKNSNSRRSKNFCWNENRKISTRQIVTVLILVFVREYSLSSFSFWRAQFLFLLLPFFAFGTVFLLYWRFLESLVCRREHSSQEKREIVRSVSAYAQRRTLTSRNSRSKSIRRSECNRRLRGCVESYKNKMCARSSSRSMVAFFASFYFAIATSIEKHSECTNRVCNVRKTSIVRMA